LLIHIKLGLWDLLTQLKDVLIRVSDNDVVGLVATGPDDYIGIFDVRPLLPIVSGLDQRHPLLLATSAPQVQVLGIASESRERIQVAIFFEFIPFELLIAIFDSILNFIVEDLDLVSVKDLDFRLLEEWQ